jgi:hypothetical protein
MKRNAIVVFLFPVLLFMGCALTSNTTTTTVADVQRKVDEALPLGSTRQEVETWLNNQGIEFNFSDQPYFSIGESYPPEKSSSGYIHFIIRNTDRSFWVTGNIEVSFLFGKDNRLTMKLVKWIGIGP